MRITLIAGSNRTAATSTQLLRYIETILKAQAQQVTVTFLDLAELPLPLFTPDNWNFHPNARRVIEAIVDADGLILATPEYHGSISGALKNALDYVQPSQVGGKAVLSASAAGGPLGVSSLTHLQTIVRNLHGINSSEWISIGYGSNTFGEDGAPTDVGTRSRVQGVLANFLELTRKLSAKAVAAN
jgi:NAD(P)H-dependent FMN reductase